MISKASAGNGTPTSSSVTPMRPPSCAHDALVGAACSIAAAGDGVAVDRRHDGLRKEKHCVVEPVQRRQESPHIVGAALAQPHSRRRRRTSGPARSAPRPRRRAAQLVERAASASQNSMSSALALPCSMRHDGDAAAIGSSSIMPSLLHRRRARHAADRMMATAARHERSATVSTTMPMIWCSSASGSGT